MYKVYCQTGNDGIYIDDFHLIFFLDWIDLYEF